MGCSDKCPGPLVQLSMAASQKPAWQEGTPGPEGQPLSADRATVVSAFLKSSNGAPTPCHLWSRRPRLGFDVVFRRRPVATWGSPWLVLHPVHPHLAASVDSPQPVGNRSIRGMSLAEPGNREHTIYWQQFNLIRKFSHVFIPKHPYFLKENNINCQLFKAASLHFASKLFKGKNQFRHEKPNEKLHKQKTKDKTSSSKNQDTVLLVLAPPQVILIRNVGINKDACPSSLSDLLQRKNNGIKHWTAIWNV